MCPAYNDSEREIRFAVLKILHSRQEEACSDKAYKKKAGCIKMDENGTYRKSPFWLIISVVCGGASLAVLGIFARGNIADGSANFWLLLAAAALLVPCLYGAWRFIKQDTEADSDDDIEELNQADIEDELSRKRRKALTAAAVAYCALFLFILFSMLPNMSSGIDPDRDMRLFVWLIGSIIALISSIVFLLQTSIRRLVNKARGIVIEMGRLLDEGEPDEGEPDEGAPRRPGPDEGAFDEYLKALHESEKSINFRLTVTTILVIVFASICVVSLAVILISLFRRDPSNLYALDSIFTILSCFGIGGAGSAGLGQGFLFLRGMRQELSDVRNKSDRILCMQSARRLIVRQAAHNQFEFASDIQYILNDLGPAERESAKRDILKGYLDVIREYAARG